MENSSRGTIPRSLLRGAFKPSIRKLLVIGAVLLQCAALGAICAQRETVLHSGAKVFLRTQPVDPRDVMRGDYVRLRYEISRLPAQSAPEAERGELRKAGRRVYLSFDTNPRGVLIPGTLSGAKPSGKPFVRGRTLASYEPQPLAVRYGVEKYFVQQGRGLEIERGRRFQGVRVPLEVEAAVGRGSGIAVLRGMRWTPMGLDLVLPRRGRGEDFRLQVRVVNASRRPLAIVDPPDHAGLRIELILGRVPAGQEPLRFLDSPAADPRYTAADVRVVEPGQVYSTELDLTHPEYRLLRGEEDVPWDQMKYWETARLVYRPPPPAAVEGLEGGIELWQGRLVSRVFSGRNFRD